MCWKWKSRKRSVILIAYLSFSLVERRRLIFISILCRIQFGRLDGYFKYEISENHSQILVLPTPAGLSWEIERGVIGFFFGSTTTGKSTQKFFLLGLKRILYSKYLTNTCSNRTSINASHAKCKLKESCFVQLILYLSVNSI